MRFGGGGVNQCFKIDRIPIELTLRTLIYTYNTYNTYLLLLYCFEILIPETDVLSLFIYFLSFLSKILV